MKIEFSRYGMVTDGIAYLIDDDLRITPVRVDYITGAEIAVEVPSTGKIKFASIASQDPKTRAYRVDDHTVLVSAHAPYLWQVVTYLEPDAGATRLYGALVVTITDRYAEERSEFEDGYPATLAAMAGNRVCVVRTDIPRQRTEWWFPLESYDTDSACFSADFDTEYVVAHGTSEHYAVRSLVGPNSPHYVEAEPPERPKPPQF